jgi:hypothetical protein
MKRRINSDIKSHLIRSTSYTLLLALAVCVIPLALAQRNTTKTKRRQAEMGDAFPANTIVVTNTSDSGPGSLRDALAIANDGDTIDATGISGTISLTSGELQITHAVTINGPGPESLLAVGGGTRVFDNLASDVTISGFFIAGGSAPGDNGGGVLNEGGNFATLRLINCIVAGNSADFGGGIFNLNGTLKVHKCTLNSNSATFSGGAIANSAFDGAAKLIVTNSTLSFNFANGNDGAGGGIVNGAGGSTFSVASVIVSNSTLSGNSAFGGNGGGIANACDLPNVARATITNSTFSDNSAGFNANGDSIYNAGAAELKIGSTILNLNQHIGKNIFNAGRATSLGYNLSDDDGAGILTGPGDLINTDPSLFHLQDNGGPTFTHKPLPHSPAIDAGDPNFTPPPFFDQRGPAFERVSGSRIDIGSLEVQR